MKEYATSNIYVGVRCEYRDNMTCYPDGYGILKGKPGHISYYDAFVKTTNGFESITSKKVLPVYEEEVYVKKNFIFDVEPIVYYMENIKVPLVMNEEEILDFVCSNYSPAKREKTYKSMIKK